MSSSSSFFLQTKSIHKHFVASTFDIVPHKREAEEPIDTYIRKARMDDTLQKIQFVSKWCNRYQYPSQQVHQAPSDQKQLATSNKEDEIPTRNQQSNNEPEKQKQTIGQSTNKEESLSTTHQQETKKVNIDADENGRTQKEKIVTSPIKQLESPKQTLATSGAKKNEETNQTRTQQTKKQEANNVNEKEVNQDKTQNPKQQQNSQQQQQASKNQKVENDDLSPRKNSISSSQLSNTSKTDPLTIAYNKQRIEYNLTKCRFFPNCEKKDCKYFHPQIECKFFPNCKSGISCMFLHKNCRYGANCKSINCIYTHPPLNFIFEKQIRSKITSSLGQFSLKQAAKKVLSSINKQNEERNKKANT